MDKYGVVVNVPENKVKEYKFECPACKKKIERVTTNIYICPDCGTKALEKPEKEGKDS